MDERTSAAYARFDDVMKMRLLQIRQMIFDIAAQDKAIGPINETLKWGEPSYLTEQTKSGTTIRLSNVKNKPDQCGIYVHCQISLISEFRDNFSEELEFSGNRAVLIDIHKPLNEDLIEMFLQKALTYHLRK